MIEHRETQQLHAQVAELFSEWTGEGGVWCTPDKFADMVIGLVESEYTGEPE